MHLKLGLLGSTSDDTKTPELYFGCSCLGLASISLACPSLGAFLAERYPYPIGYSYLGSKGLTSEFIGSTKLLTQLGAWKLTSTPTRSGS